ncbi:uncharacterized protein LOC131204101 isoform X1 [Ahaetulla prasina]|uniref:uncharacterized protein LOC131204101 isoform X1 n=1 Tax=Ahaetulla prasina TaxID=499056 RepID=UPI002649137A|nr:uncharacterized protein LOC131204101 isoform X1 [Ahaetulla prasina]
MMIAALFIIGGAVTVFTIFRRRQKANRSDTENDLIDLPSAQKPASLPLNQNEEVKSQLTAENIQVVHLDNMKEQEEEVQKTSSQPPYYDMAATEPTPNTDKLNFNKCHLEILDAGDDLTLHSSHHDQRLPKKYLPSFSPLSYFQEDVYLSHVLPPSNARFWMPQRAPTCELTQPSRRKEGGTTFTSTSMRPPKPGSLLQPSTASRTLIQCVCVFVSMSGPCDCHPPFSLF